MPKVNLEKTIHAGGRVFFAGEAVVSDQDKELIEAELERQKRLEADEAEGAGETPKKGKKKATEE